MVPMGGKRKRTVLVLAAAVVAALACSGAASATTTAAVAAGNPYCATERPDSVDPWLSDGGLTGGQMIHPCRPL
jgi:ABC-type transport system substrate-binding protein